MFVEVVEVDGVGFEGLNFGDDGGEVVFFGGYFFRLYDLYVFGFEVFFGFVGEFFVVGGFVVDDVDFFYFEGVYYEVGVCWVLCVVVGVDVVYVF